MEMQQRINKIDLTKVQKLGPVPEEFWDKKLNLLPDLEVPGYKYHEEFFSPSRMGTGAVIERFHLDRYLGPVGLIFACSSGNSIYVDEVTENHPKVLLDSSMICTVESDQYIKNNFKQKKMAANQFYWMPPNTLHRRPKMRSSNGRMIYRKWYTPLADTVASFNAA